MSKARTGILTRQTLGQCTNSQMQVVLVTKAKGVPFSKH